MLSFVPGQRWISETEPELGLGMVLSVAPHQVTVLFRATGTTRVYSITGAPLKRVQFRPGETIRAGERDEEFKISEVSEENGLLIYHSNGHTIQEPLLSDQMSFTTPRERLLAGYVDPSPSFDLRHRALQFASKLRASPVRGFVGGRISLVPHQLYIAAQGSARARARLLLADEVGLGKTIESCLILHRLLLTGRASRVLILVPESLVHQWFVELYRRFNLWFAIFDEERCEAIEENDPEANPFADDQLIIASIDLLSQRPTRLAQAAAAQWDLLIVDEAHHLRWSVEEASPEYKLVETLAAATPHVLLVTATPEQLGEASHFARLRLLDPERFHDLDAYLAEHAQYEKIARSASALLQAQPLPPENETLIAASLNIPAEELRTQLASPDGRQKMIDRLLDQHGTGRVMFRNTRAAMSGFPERTPHLEPLKGDATLIEKMKLEFQADLDPHAEKPAYDFSGDPRVLWLADFLRNNPGEKVLLISRYREKVEALDAALKERINVKAALFHEKLSLIQRDRNAAWFSEEDGAQILLCSEIGSEGRNFQFAHHLVLFDLPLSPELLEQRIGRLDRIGQTGDIHIHVPHLSGTPQHVLARWYHEGLNAFSEYFSGGAELYEQLSHRVREVALAAKPAQVKKLISETQSCRAELAEKLHAGRDRLLELHSHHPAAAGELVAQIQAVDSDTSLDQVVLDLFDHFNIHIDELGNRTFNMGAGDLFKDKIPGLPAEGLTVTADRARAITREDVAFLSPDHPILTSLLDMLLGSEQGNSAFALWPEAPSGGVMVEAVYVLETLAPPALQIARFLPPTPIRILLNHKRKEFTEEISPEILRQQLKNAEPSLLNSQMQEFGSLLPGMIHVTEIIAGKRSKPIIEAALAAAREKLGAEVTRLEELQASHQSASEAQVTTAREQLAEIEKHIGAAAVRLDAIRLILAKAAPAAAPA